MSKAQYLVPWGALLVSVVALAFSLFNHTQLRRRKRRRLINAIYHHAGRTIQAAEEFKEAYRKIRGLIEKDPAYTPYAVISSSAGDLAYDQVIDALEWLNEKEEKAVILYFHSQSDLLALGQSFNSEFVRNWNKDRKLGLLGIFEKRIAETLGYAHEAKAHLDAKRSYRE